MTRSPFRRLLRWALVGLVGLGVLGTTAWVFRRPLFGGLIARTVERALHEELGGDWKVGDVGGSWIDDLVLEDVRLVTPGPAQSMREALVPKVEATYAWRGLLRGEGLAAVHTIRARDVRLHLDLDRASETPGEGLPSFEADPVTTVLPTIDVEGSLRIDALGRTIDVGEARVATDGTEALDVALREILLDDESIEGSAEGRIVRRSDEQFRWTSTTSLAGVRVPTAVWFLDGRLVGQVVTPGGLISFTADESAVEAETGRLDLAAMPAWIRAFAPEKPGWPARGRLEGRVRLKDPRGPAMHVQLKAEDLAWAERTIDQIDARIETDREGRIRIERLDVLAEEGSARITAAVLDPAFPYLFRDARQVMIDVPDLRTLVPSLEERVELQVEAGDADGRAFVIHALRAASAQGTIEGTGRLELAEDPEQWRASEFALEITGRVERLDRFLEDLAGGATLGATLAGTLDRLKLDVDLRGRDARWHDVSIQSVEAQGVLTELETIDLGTLRIATARGHVEGTGTLAFGPFRFDARLDAAVPDLEEIAELSGRATAGVQVHVDDEAWRIDGRVEGRDLAIGSEALGRVDAAFAIDTGVLHVRRADARGPWGQAGGAGTWRLGGSDIDVATFDATIDGQAVRLASPTTVRVEDSILHTGPLAIEAFEGRLETRVEVDLDAGRARFDRTRWIQEELHIESAPGLRVGWRDDALTVSDLRVRVEEHDLRLVRPVTVHIADGQVRAEGLEVETHDTVVRGRVAYGDQLEADLRVDAFPLARLKIDAPGRAWVHLALRGDEAALHARVSELTWEEWSGDLRLTARQGKEGGIEVTSIRLGGDLPLTGRASLPYRVSSDGLASLPREAARLHLEGVIPVPSTFGVKTDAIRVTLDGTGDTLRTRLANGDAEILATVTPERVEATARLLHDGVARVRGRATLDRGVAWSAAEGFETLADATLAAHVDGTLADWERVRALVPLVRSLKGTARASVRAEGPVRSPSIDAFLEVQGLEAELEQDLPTLSKVNARIVWRDGDVVIDRMRGEVGYAPFEARGRVANVLQDDRTFDLGLKGEYLLLARNASMRVRSDLDLRLEGTLDALRLAGSATIRDLLYVAPVAMDGDAESGATGGEGGFVLLSLPDEPLRSMKLDLRIRADDTIRIRNNLVHGNAGMDLRITGTGFRPEPSGRIVSENAAIYLPANSLHVDTAEVLFPPDAPFRPRLRATARTRASGYFLGVRASGTLPDIDVSVFSRPRLSDENAMLLLATGAMSEGGGGAAGVQSVTLQKVFEFFGDNLLSFAKGTADPEARPFFDRFTLTVGRQRTRSGRDTVEGDVELVRRLHFYGERDLWDETNLGFIWRLRFR